MDHEIKSNLYPCAHCSQSGTCSSGESGTSCVACIRANELKGKQLYGLLCGSCNGIGLAEPRTERINKRIKPVLSMVLIFCLLMGIYLCAVFKSPYFGEVLAFSSTLLGSVVGYYFSAKSSRNS